MSVLCSARRGMFTAYTVLETTITLMQVKNPLQNCTRSAKSVISNTHDDLSFCL